MIQILVMMNSLFKNDGLKEFLYEGRNKKFKSQIKVQAIHERMLLNCLKCRKNTKSKNPAVVKKPEKIMLLPKYSV